MHPMLVSADHVFCFLHPVGFIRTAFFYFYIMKFWNKSGYSWLILKCHKDAPCGFYSDRVFLLLHPTAFIQTVFFQKCKVLFLYRPCAQSSSIEYVNKIFSGGFTDCGKKHLIGLHFWVLNTRDGSLIKNRLHFHWILLSFHPGLKPSLVTSKQ